MAATKLSEDNCYVALTHEVLDSKAIMDRVRSPKAGAIVLFAGMCIISYLAPIFKILRSLRTLLRDIQLDLSKRSVV